MCIYCGSPYACLYYPPTYPVAAIPVAAPASPKKPKAALPKAPELPKPAAPKAMPAPPPAPKGVPKKAPEPAQLAGATLVPGYWTYPAAPAPAQVYAPAYAPGPPSPGVVYAQAWLPARSAPLSPYLPFRTLTFQHSPSGGYVYYPPQ
jgi:hypothetical protein